MTPRQQILAILKSLEKQEQIDIIESIGKQLRKANSVKINNRVKGIVMKDDRPDEINLKEN